MIHLKEYSDLNDVLIHLKIQVVDSLDFAQYAIPYFSNPEDLFYYLKSKTTYVDDPDSIELLMTMETLFSGNRTGTPGGGDCDDFTITALASLIVNGFYDNEIILAGREKENPVHIYCRTFFENEWFVFDLTEDEFNEDRNYKYYQYLKFTL